MRDSPRKRGLYIFDSPVKFKNKNGETVDKSNKVKPHTKNGAPCFKSESNDIEVHLPATIQGGVSLKDEEVNVSMKPIPSVMSKRALSVGKQKDENSVVYEDVFDNFTDIVYTFTYDGVKEDIVLEKYNGKNTFDFEVSTGGLSLEEEKGALLLKNENGEVKATMGEIVIFSADNKNNTFGKYKITEKQKNNSYIITVCVDVAYLTSPDTKYPVTIDPPTEITGSSGIEDMQVFKGTDGTGKTETSAGRSGVSRVGWTDWGACRTLVKFNDGLLSSKKINRPEQIKLAMIEFRDLMAQSQSTMIACHQFNGSDTWSESDTKTWKQLEADKVGDLVGKKYVSATTGIAPTTVYKNPSTDTWKLWHRYNLTTVVKTWTQDSDLIKQGLIFKADTSEMESASKSAYMKTFSSMQGSKNYKPYFYISYKNKASISVKINLASSTASTDVKVGNKLQLTPYIVPSESIQYSYKWSSSDTSKATVSQSGLVTAIGHGTVTIKLTATTTQGVTSTAEKVISIYEGKARLNIFYDYGYNTRFASAKQRINSIMTKVRKKYIDDFGILLMYDDPVLYHSSADLCIENGNNIDDICTCEPDQNYQGANTGCTTPDMSDENGVHHKNANRIMIHGWNKTSKANALVLLFTGHKVCYIGTDAITKEKIHKINTETCNLSGLSFYEEGVAAIFAQQIVDVDKEAKTTAHEIGHLFKADDHYYGKVNDPYYTNDYCIYGDFIDVNNVCKNLTTCKDCTEKIKSNNKLYNHS